MEGIPQHIIYKEGIKLKKLIMLKEIKAIKKQIEKLDNSMSGKTDDFKITKKKELLNLYKKLFRNKLMNENIHKHILIHQSCLLHNLVFCLQIMVK